MSHRGHRALGRRERKRRADCLAKRNIPPAPEGVKGLLASWHPKAYVVGMPASKQAKPLPAGIEEEGFKRKAGRPRDQRPIKTILRQLPSVEDQIVANPEAYDPKVGDKVLALGVRILFERFLFADEDEISLKQKIALAIQIGQFIESSKAPFFAKHDGKHPRTTEALEAERAKREANLAKLSPYIRKVQGNANIVPTPEKVEAALDAMAPEEDTDAAQEKLSE